MIERYFKPIMDHKVDLQERTFRLVTGFTITALILMLMGGLVTGENKESLLLLSGCIVLVVIITAASISRQQIHTGATLVTIILLIFFPINFFVSGGMYGGTPLWFAFFFVYINLTLQGEKNHLFCMLSADNSFVLLC